MRRSAIITSNILLSASLFCLTTFLHAQTFVGNAPPNYNSPDQARIKILNAQCFSGLIKSDECQTQFAELTHPVRAVGDVSSVISIPSLKSNAVVTMPRQSASANFVQTSYTVQTATEPPQCDNPRSYTRKVDGKTVVHITIDDSSDRPLTPDELSELRASLSDIPTVQLEGLSKIQINLNDLTRFGGSYQSDGTDNSLVLNYSKNLGFADIGQGLEVALGHYIYNKVLTTKEQVRWVELVKAQMGIPGYYPSKNEDPEDDFVRFYRDWFFGSANGGTSLLELGIDGAINRDPTELERQLLIASFFSQQSTPNNKLLVYGLLGTGYPPKPVNVSWTGTLQDGTLQIGNNDLGLWTWFFVVKNGQLIRENYPNQSVSSSSFFKYPIDIPQRFLDVFPPPAN